ncbi:MAG: hypothetical protein IIX16_05675 [Clostridia bacterium]|nr:hypothetical protein [Clostridia bacterium]
MKISKKILAILLAVTLALSLFAVSASAAGTPTGTEAMTVTITTDNETYEAEAAVQVKVTIASNYNVPSFRFPIMFDSEVYELPTIIGLKSYGACAAKGTINENHTNGGADFIPEAYDPSAFGCVLVQWTASVANGEVGYLNNEAGELAFTFELKTKTTAVGKTGTIFIPAESDLFYYQAIENPADATTFYYLNAETCQMTFVEANAMVVGEQVSLVPNEDFGTPGVVDEENRRVYGLAVGIASNAEIKEYVKPTGKAVLRSTPTDFGYGTGTKLNLAIDGVNVKSYDLVIFGDIDGDAISDNNDLSFIISYAAGDIVCEDATVAFAGDLTNDGVIDIGDLPVYLEITSGSIVIDQTNPY